MTFYPPDLQEFPCLAMAIEAITQGGLRPCILNGANEEAVHAYLRGEISFGAIARTVRYAFAQSILEPPPKPMIAWQSLSRYM